MTLSLRPYQHHAVNAVRESYLAGNTAPLLWMPTGAGKTVVFCHVAASSAARGKRSIILVHRRELVRQTSLALHKNGVRHGLIHPDYTMDAAPHAQVASVQTLVKRLDKIHPPDLIIIDECHHANAGTWRTIIEAFPKARLLGVTATPCRSDGTGLGVEAGGFFDDLILGPTVRELISMGFLVKPVVYAPKEKLDLSRVGKVAGDYNKKHIDAIVDKPSVIGDAVAHYARICRGVPAVAFCNSILSAQHTADQFRAAGFRAYAVNGDDEDDYRDRVLAGLGNGSVDVVCSCDIISEGTDIPAIGCAILLRPTMSESLFLQQVGRALRPVPGKSHAVILDHVGNVLTHGMPDDDREWSLDGVKKRARSAKDDEDAIKVSQCEECFAIHNKAPICPSCGYVYPVQQVRQLQQVDGELKEITEQDRLAIRRQRIKEESSARSYAELVAIEVARGYKRGWAAHKAKARGYQIPT